MRIGRTRLLLLLTFLFLTSCTYHGQYVQPAEKFMGHYDRVMDISWSPDGKRFATCAFDGTIRVWDAGTQKVKRILYADTQWVLSVEWSPDGKRLVSTTTKSVQLWDPDTGREIYTLVTNPESSAAKPVFGPNNVYAAWSPDGLYLAVYGWIDGTIRITEGATGKLVNTLKAHKEMVYSVQWSQDGTRLSSVGWDGKLRLWNTLNWQEQAVVDVLTHGMVIRAEWSPDASHLSWFGFFEREIWIWDATTEKVERKLANPVGVSAVAWSPDSKTIAAASRDGKLRLWDVATGKLVKTLSDKYHEDKIAWSPDGKHLATVASQGMIITLWDMETGTEDKLLSTGGTVTSMTWSPDGSRLATGSYDGTVIVWGNL